MFIEHFMTFMVGTIIIIVIENVRSTFTTLDARMIKEQNIAVLLKMIYYWFVACKNNKFQLVHELKWYDHPRCRTFADWVLSMLETALKIY